MWLILFACSPTSPVGPDRTRQTHEIRLFAPNGVERAHIVSTYDRQGRETFRWHEELGDLYVDRNSVYDGNCLVAWTDRDSAGSAECDANGDPVTEWLEDSVVRYARTYDDAGRSIQVRIEQNGVPGMTESLAWDAAGRVVHRERVTPDWGVVWDEQLGYDARFPDHGIISEQVLFGTSRTYQHDALGRRIESSVAGELTSTWTWEGDTWTPVERVSYQSGWNGPVVERETWSCDSARPWTRCEIQIDHDGDEQWRERRMETWSR